MALDNTLVDDSQRFWVWVFGSAQVMEEVLRKRRMGFPLRVSNRVATMGKGDRVIIYASRGAFGNPTRDRSRVVAVGTLSSDPGGRSVQLAGEPFPLSVSFTTDSQVEGKIRTDAPEVGPIAARLSFVKRPEVWGLYFRNTPLEVSQADFDTLASLLD